MIDSLTAEYVDWLFAESPVTASFHGADGYDDQLPDLSAEGFARRDAAEDDWVARFSALRDDELADDQRIDRDLVLSNLRGATITRDWLRWRRDPDAYVGAGLMGVFSLFIRRLHPEPELVRAAVAVGVALGRRPVVQPDEERREIQRRQREHVTQHAHERGRHVVEIPPVAHRTGRHSERKSQHDDRPEHAADDRDRREIERPDRMLLTGGDRKPLRRQREHE